MKTLKKAEQYVFKMANGVMYRHAGWKRGDADPVEPGIKVHRCLPVLLKERFGDAIQFVEDIPQEVRSRFIGTLGLQIVLENCVKHNAATTRAAFDHPHVY